MNSNLKKNKNSTLEYSIEKSVKIKTLLPIIAMMITANATILWYCYKAGVFTPNLDLITKVSLLSTSNDSLGNEISTLKVENARLSKIINEFNKDVEIEKIKSEERIKNLSINLENERKIKELEADIKLSTQELEKSVNNKEAEFVKACMGAARGVTDRDEILMLFQDCRRVYDGTIEYDTVKE
ncbi:MAG: hypothetical protein AB7U29_11615 [Desulfobulbus sp.]